jgi:hypothetical protein
MEYKNGKIYIIKSNYGPEFYIGSTVLTLEERFKKHISYLSDDEKRITSKILLNTYGIDRCYIELLENYPCASKKELKLREGYYHRQHINSKNLVNIVIEGRTEKEYYQDNKERINIRRKLYIKNNINKIKEYRGRVVTCSCGQNATLNHLSRHYRSQRHYEELNKKLFDEMPLK